MHNPFVVHLFFRIVIILMMLMMLIKILLYPVWSKKYVSPKDTLQLPKFNVTTERKMVKSGAACLKQTKFWP